MKRRYWIGGVLLVMMLWGMMGCGRAEAPPAVHHLADRKSVV